VENNISRYRYRFRFRGKSAFLRNVCNYLQEDTESRNKETNLENYITFYNRYLSARDVIIKSSVITILFGTGVRRNPVGMTATTWPLVLATDER
jgi:hypothetical protein